MKKIFAAFLISSLGLIACNKEVQPKPLTPKEIARKADSIVAVRLHDLDAQSQKDLSHRMKIEVKVKADSILQALAPTSQDSTRPVPNK